MKFVFFGYDFSVDVARRLLQDGHEMLGVFTFECDNIFNFNRQIIALAEKKNLPLSLEKPAPEDIENFIAQGCEVFLACGYPHKIPPINETKAYGINTHPTLLPKGRGLMPSPYIIMHAPEAAGFTVHKMTPEFDAGDILYQEKITLTDRDTVDSYSAQIAKKTPGALSRIMADLPHFWREAKPQDETQASHFKPPTKAMRTIDWTQDIKDIDRMMRAFGSYGALAVLNGRTYGVFAHEYTQEPHDFAPGTIVAATEDHIKTAAQGGFLIFRKFAAL